MDAIQTCSTMGWFFVFVLSCAGLLTVVCVFSEVVCIFFNFVYWNIVLTFLLKTLNSFCFAATELKQMFLETNKV